MACMVAAHEGTGTSNVRLQNISTVANRKVNQMINSTWAMMVTAVGKGKYLISRRKERMSSLCPFLSYDVCRMDDGGQDDQYFMNEWAGVLCPIDGLKRRSDRGRE